jgi:nitric oxide reductase large subunit
VPRRDAAQHLRRGRRHGQGVAGAGAAIRQVAAHYDGLFGTDPTLAKLREQYAMTEGALPEKASARR